MKPRVERHWSWSGERAYHGEVSRFLSAPPLDRRFTTGRVRVDLIVRDKSGAHLNRGPSHFLPPDILYEGRIYFGVTTRPNQYITQWHCPVVAIYERFVLEQVLVLELDEKRARSTLLRLFVIVARLRTTTVLVSDGVLSSSG